MARTKTTTYSPAQREKIISHVLTELAGGRAVSRILREDGGMPAARTFWNWYFADEELMQKVARARENGVEAIMDETLVIADTQEVGEVVTEDGGKTTRRKEDMLGHRKLRIETRLKYAQMIAPRKYGPKLDVTSGGEKVGSDLDEVGRATRLASIFAELERRKGADAEPDES